RQPPPTGRRRRGAPPRLDWRRSLAEERRQPARRRQLVERVEAEQADRRLGARIVAQTHTAEPARVPERDLAAVVERQEQLEKARRPALLVRAPTLHPQPPAPAAPHP